MGDLFLGATTYLEGINVIIKHKLWGYLLLPILITVLIAFALFGSGWTFGDDLGALIIQLYPFEWGLQFIEKAVSILSGFAIVLLGLLLFRYIVIILCAPFLSFLSEKMENKILGSENTKPFTLGGFISDVARGIRISIRNIALELLFTIPLFLLGLIPFLTPFTTVLIFLIQAFYAGFGNVDFLLERRFGVRQSIKFARSNRMLMIGNGAVYVGMLFLLIGFLFAPTLGTAAGTVAGLKKLDINDEPALADEELI